VACFTEECGRGKKVDSIGCKSTERRGEKEAGDWETVRRRCEANFLGKWRRGCQLEEKSKREGFGPCAKGGEKIFLRNPGMMAGAQGRKEHLRREEVLCRREVKFWEIKEPYFISRKTGDKAEGKSDEREDITV